MIDMYEEEWRLDCYERTNQYGCGGDRHPVPTSAQIIKYTKPLIDPVPAWRVCA